MPHKTKVLQRIKAPGSLSRLYFVKPSLYVLYEIFLQSFKGWAQAINKLAKLRRHASQVFCKNALWKNFRFLNKFRLFEIILDFWKFFDFLEEFGHTHPLFWWNTSLTSKTTVAQKCSGATEIQKYHVRTDLPTT